jgi:hypothetical protein
VNSREKVPKKCRYRDFSVRKFGGPEDEILGTRHQKSRCSERGSDPSVCGRTCVVESSVSEIWEPGVTDVST